MEESLSAYMQRKLKVTGKRRHKVQHSLGVYDMFKYFRKHRPKGKEYMVMEHLYYQIIRRVNELLAEELTEIGVVHFPLGMGSIHVIKFKATPYFNKQGKLIHSASIDWYKTLKLWYEDKEAEKEKLLIRRDQKYRFTLNYSVRGASYPNKAFYEFTVNQALSKRILKLAEQGDLDAFLSKN